MFLLFVYYLKVELIENYLSVMVNGLMEMVVCIQQNLKKPENEQ